MSRAWSLRTSFWVMVARLGLVFVAGGVGSGAVGGGGAGSGAVAGGDSGCGESLRMESGVGADGVGPSEVCASVNGCWEDGEVGGGGAGISHLASNDLLIFYLLNIPLIILLHLLKLLLHLQLDFPSNLKLPMIQGIIIQAEHRIL